MARIAIVGCGATGTRAARQLARSSEQPDLVLIDDATGVSDAVAASLGRASITTADTVPGDCSIVVLAVRGHQHARLARTCLERGQHVVSVSDGVDDIRRLLELDGLARRNDATLIVGAGLMPGLSDVLAMHGASWLDDVEEIHVSKFGTGGPDCARQHHAALRGFGNDWRDGEWVRRAGGSGRELAWFPPPVQAADCYRAALGDPILLVRAHPEVQRVTARMAATRRDRLTMHLPMLRRPHPEGLLGAIRVELRGTTDGARREIVLGCAERPAVAAGAVAATAVLHLVGAGDAHIGAWGLSEGLDVLRFLHDLRQRGLRPEIFVGDHHST